jgi:hypothetical protein
MEMVCNCVADKPTYPQNEEWGPLLWWILHALAGSAGTQSNLLLRGDEQRAWPLFFKELPSMLPCPYCRDHLQTYQKSHPFALPQNAGEWNSYVTTYVYDLHEDVNARIGKPSFPKEDLSKTYSNTKPFKETFDALEKLVDRAMKQEGVTLFAWRAWVKQMKMLRATLI